MTEAEIKELQQQNYELRAERDKLKAMNSNLKAENSDLETRIEKLQKRIANYVHEIKVANEKSAEVNQLRRQVCDYGQKAERLSTELKNVKKRLFERNRQYQDDCITINRLNVTIDTLVERLAANIRK